MMHMNIMSTSASISTLIGKLLPVLCLDWRYEVHYGGLCVIPDVELYWPVFDFGIGQSSCYLISLEWTDYSLSAYRIPFLEKRILFSPHQAGQVREKGGKGRRLWQLCNYLLTPLLQKVSFLSGQTIHASLMYASAFPCLAIPVDWLS
jgi:hypothetical protein